MKKPVVYLCVILLACSFSACGKGGGSGTAAAPANTTAPVQNTGGAEKSYTATVIAPEGWHIVDSKYPLIQYGNNSADGFWIRKPTTGNDLSAAATSYRNVEGSNKSVQYTWDEVKDVKVNTYDAKNLSYVGVYSGISLKYSVYFVEKDNNIFIIVCQSQSSQYDAVKKDFDAFLSSFTIQSTNG